MISLVPTRLYYPYFYFISVIQSQHLVRRKQIVDWQWSKYKEDLNKLFSLKKKIFGRFENSSDTLLYVFFSIRMAIGSKEKFAPLEKDLLYWVFTGKLLVWWMKRRTVGAYRKYLYKIWWFWLKNLIFSHQTIFYDRKYPKKVRVSITKVKVVLVTQTSRKKIIATVK